jgi:hypothetical protein
MVAMAIPGARPSHERAQGTEEREGDMVVHIARAKNSLALPSMSI